MKTLKPKNNNIIPVKQIMRDVAVFFVNIAVIIGIYIASIYLNSMDETTSSAGFLEYFNRNSSNFLYLTLSLVLFMVVLMFCLYFDDKSFFNETKNIEMIFLIIEVCLILCYLSGRYINIYLRPIALASLLAVQFFGKRYAVYLNLMMTLLIFLMDAFTNFNITSPDLYASLFIGYSTGIIAIYLVGEVSERITALLRGLVLAIPTLVCFLFLKNFMFLRDIEGLICCLIAGELSVVLYLMLLPVFEAIFKKLTVYKLAELTQHSAPLIKKLIEEAPGTFNHSIVVANLAEACATAIGEDSLMARTCAYYHDVGKLRNPEFFKENQDDHNAHDELMPELSVSIIKAHAKDGYELLTRRRYPKELANVCIEHHGTMPILYFYAKAKKLTDGEVKIDQFCYPGPKPQTKISAIIMIVDSSEAAVRSMTDRSRETVFHTVDKIISDRIKLGQFDDCPLTMNDLSIIRHTIVNNLTGIYHKRVEYPRISVEQMAAEGMSKSE